MIFKLDRNALREYDGLEQAVHSIKFYILNAENEFETYKDFVFQTNQINL